MSIRLKYYRELSEEERRRDLGRFLRWLLEKSKGTLVEVGPRWYNRWPGGHGPLGRYDARLFYNLVEKVMGEAAVEPVFVKYNKRHWRGRRYYISRGDVLRILKHLGYT